jgi:hypothetical protein
VEALNVANGPPAPVPGWITSLSQLVTTVGFPVVVAGALLWFLLTRFQTNMDSITTRLELSSTNAQQFLIISRQQITELEKQTQLFQDINDHLAELVGKVEYRKKLLEEREKEKAQ